MRRLMILNFTIIGTIFSASAQKTIETYDVNEDKQTTVIIRDTEKSDQDILSELDLDDYTVGEEVYITAEMWAEMQTEKEKGNEPKINESPKVEKKEAEAIVVKEEIVIQEKIAEKPARAKAKKKKSKRYRMKKSKRRKYSSRKGKMACYSF